jgi:hypothetical protein
MIRPVPYPKFQHYVAYYIVPVAESKCDTGFQPVISKITGKMPMSLWKNLQQLPFRNRYYVVPVAERSHPNILCSIFRRGGTRLPPFPGRYMIFVGGQYRLADPCSGMDGFRNRYYVVLVCEEQFVKLGILTDSATNFLHNVAESVRIPGFSGYGTARNTSSLRTCAQRSN